MTENSFDPREASSPLWRLLAPSYQAGGGGGAECGLEGCPAPGLQRCGGCQGVAYCGRAHQRAAWPQHRRHCAPFRIVTAPGVGRHLVATRDIGGYIQPRCYQLTVAAPRSPRGGDPAGGPHHGRAAPVHGPGLPRLPRPRQPGRLPLLALLLAAVRAAVRDTPPAHGGVQGVRSRGRQADTAQARAANEGSRRFHNHGEGPFHCLLLV